MIEPFARSKRRTMQGGWVDRESLPRGENGRALCRWCRLEVPKGRQTFCSEWCVEQWKLRTDPGFLREKVLERDQGICASCGVDAIAAFTQLKRSRGTARLKLMQHWGLARLNRSSLWDADHIVAVAEGGGECDLDNLRTLCLRCHRRVTLELRRRLALTTRLL